MKIKDVLKLAATYLGLPRVTAYLDAENPETDAEILSVVDCLTRCANLVIDELACSYIPMTTVESVTPVNGKVYYSDLTKKALGIIAVYDDNGEKVDYPFDPEYIKTDLPHIRVCYRYLPAAYGLTDEIGYDEKTVSARVIAYGTAAEYSLTERAFDESALWRKRFTSEIREICAPKNGKIKERVFI